MENAKWDARGISKNELQTSLFSKLDKLIDGDEFGFIVNVSPQTILDSIQQRSPQFIVKSQAGTNNEWNIQITKKPLSELQKQGCCGMCGGK